MSLPTRYTILRSLGAGSQGEVFLAVDRYRADALVAVKRLRSGDGSRAKALSDEFLTLSQLQHPNIARVRDFGQHDRSVFFTTDYISGGNLLTWMSTGPLPERWSWLSQAAGQALSALAYLSRRGVSHGDIKPANLLVEPGVPDRELDSRLKLIDFGTASRPRRTSSAPCQAASNITGKGAATPAYRPPRELIAAGDARVDLYALGISLFHAAAGRLPFRLGDRRALEEWWSQRKPACLHDYEPEAPVVLDSLISRLTAAREDAAFGTAAEALEFLKEKIALRPPSHSERGPQIWLDARASFIEELIESGVDRQVNRPQLILGPPGSGKSAVLQAMVSRLQILGYRTLLFRGRDDRDALRELELVASELSGSSLSVHVTAEERPLDILLRLRSGRVAILLCFDDTAESQLPMARHSRGRQGSTGTPPAERDRTFFRTLIRNLVDALSSDARASLPFFCVGTSHPEELFRWLEAPDGLFERRHLLPLSSVAIQEVSREYFMVENVPESVVSRVMSESDGQPDAVVEALGRLHAAGVRSDSVGHLRLPPELPERLVPEAHERSDVARLGTASRRTLGRLAIAREAVSADELAERFPSWDVTLCQSRLEELQLLGFCHLVNDQGTPRFKVRSRSSSPLPHLLDPDDEMKARDEFAGFLSRTPTLRSETRLAMAWNELARGRRLDALSLSSSLAATLLRRGRETELVELFGALDGASDPDTPDRRTLSLRLRVAQANLRLTRYEEALQALGERSFDLPRWYRRHAQKLKARVLEARGQPQDAITELKWLLEEEEEAAAGSDCSSSLLRMELRALLAPLCFQSGDAEAGRSYLETADEALDRYRRLPEALADLAGARVMGLFASSLAVHDDLARSVRFLEAALSRLRAGGRESPLRTTLNELGILYVRCRRWREALEVFRETQDLARRAGDRLSALRATYNQAVTHYRLDELREAEKLFHRARNLSDDIGVHAFAPTIWLGFAGVLREQGKVLKAVRLYRRVLRGRGDVRLNDTALAHNNLAEIYLQLGRLGKSLHHSREAVRIARRIANRFLVALTTCLHGLIHGALGRQSDACSHLEEAERIARALDDPRPSGFCQLTLGRLALWRDEPRVAVGHLRRAIASSRDAADRTHLQLAMGELATILVDGGKLRTARRWLPRLTRDLRHGGFARGRIVAATLKLKLDPDWPGCAERLSAICREALDRGELWETFQAMRGAVRDPGLEAAARDALALEFEALKARLVRRMQPEFRTGFDQFWTVEGRASSDTGQRRSEASSEEPVESGQGKLSPGPPPLRALLNEGQEALLTTLLEEFRRIIGARSLIIAELRAGIPVTFRVASERSDRGQVVREVCRERAAALREACEKNGPVAAAPYLMIRLPGRSPDRVVCVEPFAETAGASQWIARLPYSARLLAACALELDQSRTGLHRQSARLAEARAEIRRLHSLVTRNASELETALMTHRLEMREVQNQLESRGLRSRRPNRTPVGDSVAMKAILNRLPRIAENKYPVLILGESGVGKDLIARWIHELGPRRDLPYVTEVCNLSDSLIEAELFGFAKGAFTDAQEDRQGLFQRAAGGSIYLDEITEIAPRLQAKILRVIEEKRVRRVGDHRSVPVDFRILASSRQPTRRLEEGTLLRKDLYYRLNTEVIEIPPLRDRPEDLPRLIDGILDDLTAESGAQRPYIHPEVLESWKARTWPGNVRELENELQRLLLENPHEFTPDSIASASPARAPSNPAGGSGHRPLSLREARLVTERESILRALERHRGNASRAAKELKVTRRYLGSLIDKHGIELRSIKRAWANGLPPREREAGPSRPTGDVEERENASPSWRSPSDLDRK